MSEHVNSKWVGDIAAMHTKFGVNTVLRGLDREKLEAFLKFRIDFLQEELDEMRTALVDYQAGKMQGVKAADDTVDALIDLCVVAIGTLDAFDVNSDEAWNRVHKKNMEKEVGIKASRPNPLGLPDLIKPEGWTAPTHADNIGLLSKVYGS
jgi:predicted HAD superfamily Cof-like phosphohydrolase